MSDFDLRGFLPYLLNQAAEAASLDFQQYYKDRYGMLRTEWRVLFHLGIFERMTASDISARARIHKTKISRAVSRLEARRFLERTRDMEDRRVEWLSLTQAGQAAYRDLRGVAARYDRALEEEIGADDMAALKRILQVLAAR
ncbi:MAG: MarR family transcriptional regulator [Pseudomonadota bacterium]